MFVYEDYILRTTEMRVCDLFGSCLVGKLAFIPQLHTHQDIYSHMRWRGWVAEEVKWAEHMGDVYGR